MSFIHPNSLISVVIPVFNAERFIAEAIRSVQQQAYPHVEIIVVDDGSTDNSLQVASCFPGVRCFQQPNSGISAARNAGVANCRGDVLAFLDADDLWGGDKLQLQIDAARTNPETDFITGQVQNFFDNDCDTREATLPVPSNAPVAGTLLIRMEAFLRVGQFDTKLKLGEFMDWYSRAIESGLKQYHLASVVLRRRVHGMSTVLQQRASRRDYLTAMKAHLDRKRRLAAANN